MRKILKAVNNAIKRLLIAAIKFYRRFLSPLKPRSSCIFYPTCSGYAVEAIEKRGIFVGLCLATWRILRCNPFNNHGGWDPVPEKKPGKNKIM